MSISGKPKHDFVAALEASLADGTFVKMQLGKVRGNDNLKKCAASPVMIRDRQALRFVFTHAKRDVTENKFYTDVAAYVAPLVGQTFLSATLFTTTKDFTLDHNKKGEPRLTTAKATFSAVAPLEHNRPKKYVIEPSRPYLKALGISLEDGRVKPSMYPKYKQICHFIEIVDDLIRLSPLRDVNALTAVDIGSGKGYLTFALYDYLTAHLNKSCRLTGIEVRADMVAVCSDLAARLKATGLRFSAVAAGETKATAVDLLIALHACDTATDDAIFQGIAGNAALIITAPCCQHELAAQISKPADALRGITKFGLFKQRQADLVTDAARCLLLEASGYHVKVIEFTSTEHTAKNLIIAASRDKSVDRDAARRQYEELKSLMNFQTQHLEQRLAARAHPAQPKNL
jgi:SAM-dependent methyltransferase